MHDERDPPEYSLVRIAQCHLKLPGARAARISSLNSDSACASPTASSATLAVAATDYRTSAAFCRVSTSNWAAPRWPGQSRRSARPRRAPPCPATAAADSIQQQLAELAQTHHAGDTDHQALSQLAAHLKQWDDGDAPAAAGGQPIVAIDAPAGMIVGSGDNIAIGAQTHVDIVSVGNTQLSTGRKLLMRATDSISLFAHKLGMKLIAASGKVEIQAHQDNIELTAAKRIVLSASEEIVIQAPKVTIVSQGAQAAYGGGAITYQLTGAYAIHSAAFTHQGPGDSQLAAFDLPKSAMAHDQHVRITDLNTGTPMANQRFRAKLEDGQEIEGTTDAQGLTQIFKSSIPFGRFTIEAIND